MKFLKVFMLCSAVSFFAIACGGGGGGGGSDSSGIQYTGVSTQALIDQNNADDMSAGAIQGGATGSSLGLTGAQTGLNNVQSRPRTLVLSNVLKNTVLNINVTAPSEVSAAGAVLTDSGTFYGDCGGTVDFTVSVNDSSGDFDGTLNFKSYCDDGATISGDTGFSGNINLFTGDFRNMSLSFNSLTAVSGNDSFTTQGSMTINFDVSPEQATMNMLMRDNLSAKVYKLENFIITITGSSNYEDITFSGKYYDPDYGYADISTPLAFRFYDADSWPSSGKLLVNGLSGIAGGSTNATLTAVSSLYCEIAADTNGNGDFDYGPVQVLWTDL